MAYDIDSCALGAVIGWLAAMAPFLIQRGVRAHRRRQRRRRYRARRY